MDYLHISPSFVAMERVNENERFVVKKWNKMTLYMCDYDWSSGSFVFKLEQLHPIGCLLINLVKIARITY
jgi:hypothetical protein